MTATKAITKVEVKRLADRLQSLLDDNPDMFDGYAVSYKGGSYTDSIFTAKIEFALITDGGVPATQKRADLMFFLPILDLKESDLDLQFHVVGSPDLFMLDGYHPRRTKWPFTIKNMTNGKIYKASDSIVYSIKRSRPGA